MRNALGSIPSVSTFGSPELLREEVVDGPGLLHSVQRLDVGGPKGRASARLGAPAQQVRSPLVKKESFRLVAWLFRVLILGVDLKRLAGFHLAQRQKLALWMRTLPGTVSLTRAFQTSSMRLLSVTPRYPPQLQHARCFQMRWVWMSTALIVDCTCTGSLLQ